MTWRGGEAKYQGESYTTGGLPWLARLARRYDREARRDEAVARMRARRRAGKHRGTHRGRVRR